MSIIETYIQEVFTKLGCDKDLISCLQREIFGKPDDSGSLSRCYSYARDRVRKREPTLAQQFIDNKAELFSADWGHLRYEIMRSDSDRVQAMYRILLKLSDWNEHAGYFNEQLSILAAKMNEMGENRPYITFSDIMRVEQRKIADPEEAHSFRNFICSPRQSSSGSPWRTTRTKYRKLCGLRMRK